MFVDEEGSGWRRKAVDGGMSRIQGGEGITGEARPEDIRGKGVQSTGGELALWEERGSLSTDVRRRERGSSTDKMCMNVGRGLRASHLLTSVSL